MLTYSGEHVTPLDPKAEQIHIIDIAHALSLLSRAGGHLKHFYTVAQHSLNCANEAEARGYSARVCLACLLHDASEAYLSDIVRPIKDALTNYLKIEKSLQECIYQKYGLGDLTDEERQFVKNVDDDVLYHEFLNINEVRLGNEEPRICGSPNFLQRPTTEVEAQFKKIYEELSQKARHEA